MTHLEFECSDEKALFILKAARLYDEGLRDIPEWIPCSERMPEEAGSYLITARTISGIRYVRPGLLYSNGKFGRDSVIAWQPLPKPYEEDNYESNNTSN